jgi:hypothetical protein
MAGSRAAAQGRRRRKSPAGSAGRAELNGKPVGVRGWLPATGPGGEHAGPGTRLHEPPAGATAGGTRRMRNEHGNLACGRPAGRLWWRRRGVPEGRRPAGQSREAAVCSTYASGPRRKSCSSSHLATGPSRTHTVRFTPAMVSERTLASSRNRPQSNALPWRMSASVHLTRTHLDAAIYSRGQQARRRGLSSRVGRVGACANSPGLHALRLCMITS